VTSSQCIRDRESTYFAGKSILLISPKFFGYDLAASEKLTQMGADVTMFDDRPSNSFLSKALIRLDKRLLETQTTQYYAKIADQIADRQFDIVFLLNPEALPVSFLEFCKSRWKDALYVMYMWDSIKNRKHTLEFVPFCDRVFTFDANDAELNGFAFKPLFYLDSYSKIRQGSHPIKYDICFMGTLHSDRYAIAKEVKEWCDSQGLRCFFYFFSQNWILYYFNKLIGRGLTAPRSEVSFVKMSTMEVVEIVASSRVVLDIQHPKQTGLTMRTLETVGSGKKLITTNDEIFKYDFYERDNITWINRLNPSENLDINFFRTDFTVVSEEIIKNYEIGNWLLDLLTYK
jgi:hypothetical protein